MPAYRIIDRETIVRRLLVEADSPEEAERIGERLMANKPHPKAVRIARYRTKIKVYSKPLSAHYHHPDEEPSQIVMREEHGQPKEAISTNVTREVTHRPDDPASQLSRPG